MSAEELTISYVAALRELLALTDNKYLERQQFSFKNGDELHFAQVASAIFAGSVKLARSIVLLLENDQSESALILVRPLSESHISLRYMAGAERNERARLFVARMFTQQERFRRDCGNSELTKNHISDDEQAEVVSNFEALAEPYGGKEAIEKMLKWKSWAGKNISYRKMARESNVEAHYTIGNFQASNAIHLSNVDDHIGEDSRMPDDLFAVRMFSSPRARFHAAKGAALTYLCIFALISKLFDIGFDREIGEIMERHIKKQSTVPEETVPVISS